MMLRAVLLFTWLVGVAHIDCAAGADVAHPDFSGVWFPDAKASGRWPTDRPYTPAMAEAREQWTRSYAPIDAVRDDENLSCIAYTLPYVMTTITQYPFELVATADRIYQFTEVFGQVRRIDMDADEYGDRLPTRMGYSRGHWEGDELVVETTHLLPLHVGHRYPSSPAQRLLERFRVSRDAAGNRQLSVEVKVVDPLVYTEPLVINMVYKAAPTGVELGEYICGQDLWDQHQDGSTSRIPWR